MTDKDDARIGRGRAIRQARLMRVRTIRRRVISGAVALFVATWLLIAIVLVSGHDPALARKTSSVVSVPNTGTSTSSGSGTSSAGSGTSSAGSGTSSSANDSSTGGTASSSSNTSSGASTSSVTTRQS